MSKLYTAALSLCSTTLFIVGTVSNLAKMVPIICFLTQCLVNYKWLRVLSIATWCDF